MRRLLLPDLVNTGVPRHGQGQGVWIGAVSTIGLSHLRSAGDHRLHEVQPWAERRLATLAGCRGQRVRPEAVRDEQRAGVLRARADARHGSSRAEQMNNGHIRVDDLQTARVRVDTTTARGSGPVSADGVLPCGHSKEHRPDLPHLTVLRATRDPLGLPVATEVRAGERADDPLSPPAIARVRGGGQRRGVLSLGEGKRAALETRASLQAAGDDSLCPLPATSVSAEQLVAFGAPGTAGTQALTRSRRHARGDRRRL